YYSCIRKNMLLFFLNMIFSILTGNVNKFFIRHYTSVIRNHEGLSGSIDNKVFIRSLFSSPGLYINASNGIKVGKNLLIGPNVSIISSSHDISKGYPAKANVGSIIIGNDCWLGDGVKILPEVIIGDNTVVAAGSIVNKSFPKGGCILAGVPAKIVKYMDNK
ncbi:acyltransferase, partial [Vibrio harveyi]|uniref:acyltransferase n=1 Tax=Vibrio harveyi TaxID=669 RepID=UPI000DF8FEF2